jgi:enoyl-CoA hydratase/carnithine racemase
MTDTTHSRELIALEELKVDAGLIWVLTSRRPEDRNPLDRQTVTRYQEIVGEAVEREDVRALIITGEGSAFSAGGDLKGYLNLYRDPDAFRKFQDDLYHVCELLESSDLISVAMVNGVCVAGGLELALSCDLITIGDTARIGDGHLKFGQLPGAGGSQRLCRAIGFQKAKEVLLTAKLYTATEAEAMGMVNAVYSMAELRERTLQLTSSMVEYSPLAVKRMKELIAISQELPRTESLDLEGETVWTYATTSHDAYEGLNCFVEKRAPAYRGE